MTTLAQYVRARTALADATRIDQVLPILDELAHVKLYAKQIADRGLLADAEAFQIKAEQRLGIIIHAAKEAGHFKQGNRVKASESSGDELLTRATLAEAGVDKHLSSRAQKLASISERALEAMMDARRQRVAGRGAIVVDPLRAAEKEEETARRKAEHAARTFEGGKVEDLHSLIASGFKASTIYADPPWHFLARSEKGEGRSAGQHYTTDRLGEITSLPVAQLAASDCTLIMWMVDWCPKLALDVIDAWGFAHKTTAFTWAKLTEDHDGIPRLEGRISDRDFHFGMGYWTRANPEDAWLATRGSPKRMNADVRQLIIHPVMEHSRKPEIHDRIERLVEGPYLELYARRPRPGWITWGNELKFEMPTDASGTPLQHDPSSGEILPLHHQGIESQEREGVE
jgi:N6-adenosine-specific RNA methylase IME4